MADETNQSIIDLSTYTGEVKHLNYYSYRKSDPKVAQFIALKTDIENKLSKGEPVYVQFHDSRRENSVGRIKSCSFKLEEHQHRNYWGGTGEPYVYCGISDIEVVWDGRKNKVKPSPMDIEYIPDWTHGTQWDWEQTQKDKPEPIIAYDHLGQQLEVGQNVCFVHRRYGNTSMKFGTVTRFTDKGSVFIKTMKLKDNARAGEELKALSMDDVIIINDELMKRILMAKLAAR